MAQSIFDRYGGFSTVRKVVSDFYDRVLDSPVLRGYFANTDMRTQIDHQTKFIATVMGGPASYSDEALRRAHAHLHISRKEVEEMIGILRDTLEDHGLERADVEEVLSEVLRRAPLVVTRHEP